MLAHMDTCAWAHTENVRPSVDQAHQVARDLLVARLGRVPASMRAQTPAHKAFSDACPHARCIDVCAGSGGLCACLRQGHTKAFSNACASVPPGPPWQKHKPAHSKWVCEPCSGHKQGMLGVCVLEGGGSNRW